MTATRVFAVDWSGRATGAAQTIWIAEARGGRLTMLENGRDRGEVVAALLREAAHDRNFAVGLDFAFSMPEWFLRDRGCDNAPALWRLVEDEGEAWLRSCEPPFWGRPGRPRPTDVEQYRQCEREARALGLAVKPVFQVGGAGAVGTGSIRGMPLLRTLRDGGFSIWPFDVARLPTVMEIYPRAFTGSVVKRSADARRSHLQRYHANAVADELFHRAVSSEDAFDAAVSALVMSAHAEAFQRLQRGDAVEGGIWFPMKAE